MAPSLTYSGTVRLTLMGLCLDDRGNNSSNGTQQQIWTNTGGTNQVWATT